MLTEREAAHPETISVGEHLKRRLAMGVLHDDDK